MHTNTQEEEKVTEDIKDFVVSSVSNENLSTKTNAKTRSKKDYTTEIHNIGGEIEPHSRQGGTLAEEDGQYEPEQSNNHSGTAREDHVDVYFGGGGEEDGMVDIGKIIERFKEATKLSIGMPNNYICRWDRFVVAVNLGQYSKNALRGRAGKHLLLTFINDHIPIRSRKSQISIIKKVWEKGLELPWPLTREDIGRLPPTRRMESPPDNVVKAWKEAMDKEPDLYNRLCWLMIAEHGIRPSHLSNLRWRDVKLDEKAQPYSIETDGIREGSRTFKTYAELGVWLCPAVRTAMMEWSKKNPYRPEDPILPDTSPVKIKRIFRRLEKRWGLPHLTPKGLRHWVATQCRVRGISEQGRCYLQGHDIDRRNMGSWYDNRARADYLIEQSQVFPDGLLGVFDNPKVELIEAIPPEVLKAVKDCLDGALLPSDLISIVLDAKARRVSSTLLR